jgi:hypothetical protein
MTFDNCAHGGSFFSRTEALSISRRRRVLSTFAASAYMSRTGILHCEQLWPWQLHFVDIYAVVGVKSYSLRGYRSALEIALVPKVNSVWVND